MLCPRCGNEIASPETQAFCPVCGLSLLSPSPAAPATSPAGSPPEPPVGFQAEGQSFLYSPSPLDAQQDPQAPLPEEPVPTPYAAPSFEAAAVVPAVAAKALKKKMGTGRKVLLGILGGILALALAFVAVSVILENNRSKNFNQAIELMDAGQYHDALEKFRSLGDYESAESLAAQCEDFIEYEEAKRLMDAGDYQKALSMFSGLSGFEDSKALATLCQNNLDYQQGTTLFNAGKYADALTYFEPLAREDFLDAKEMVSQSEYALAENLFTEGRRYEAYRAFTALGDFDDAAARAQACIVPVTNSEEAYRNEAFSATDCDLTISSGALTFLTFMKIYEGDTLVSSLFLLPGSSLKISLPAKSYQIRAAYGENWFGDEDLFGDTGSYFTMEFDENGGDTMTLEVDYTYTLDLQVSEGGNVGSRGIDRGDF